LGKVVRFVGILFKHLLNGISDKPTKKVGFPRWRKSVFFA